MPTATLSHVLAPSALLDGGGCVVWDGFPGPHWFKALRAEAGTLMSSADVQDCPTDDGEEMRGGVPSRSLLTAGGGPVQDALYASPSVHQALSQLCGCRVFPSGTRGSYSYYSRPGDYLGIHRDVHECDLTLITVLEDSAAPGEGGSLVAYPTRCDQPLSAIRSHPENGKVAVWARPGQSIVLAGGIVPHAVTPTQASQVRVISALCYEMG